MNTSRREIQGSIVAGDRNWEVSRNQILERNHMIVSMRKKRLGRKDVTLSSNIQRIYGR